ncbi:RagB/SusD family nutrient uptake outer membrane protein [Plebeiibacterium sediminum]|uniref:RagB/SusD family nutrient uptake outer membrane protein n=1 Tax=Plebeiibacterium sediminum TaxID=2992112 RepID=A0AAE3M1U0_9BACT|nr:RagB/SusD family nutrient uptake outer membrane protein [Plebeiobacterium sediminum]MCW3785573.1 RagB/SusD family nutrient uptake outer membrane protein [Plebeiobacterium sediminum]
MNKLNIKATIGAVLMTMFLMSCSDILEEQPRDKYEPSYFSTEGGINAGITSLYANLRDIYGQAYYYNTLETGTDEYTYAQSADQNFKVMDLTGEGEISSETSRSDVLWGASFRNINTASGIIENAEAVGTFSDALIAEARFFRAFDYFALVQTFGGVPLDLGAGELMFNTSPLRTSVRNTVSEVYTKAIFPDLVKAVNDLPDEGRVTGGVTKTVARLYLSKAYLTYAWWLENPNNIPTYPETSRVDPDGHDASWYYQQAYDVATEGIDNPGNFGLQPTYYDVHLGSNDRNNEILLYADRTEDSEEYNGASLTYSGAGTGDNCAVWMVTWNYTEIRSSSAAGANIDFYDIAGLSQTSAATSFNQLLSNHGGTWSSTSSVKREAAQDFGRPWTRMAPTIGAITNTFADKTNDSRYDGTFVTCYRGNWQKGGDTYEFAYNSHNMPIAMDEPVLTFLDEIPAISVRYPTEGKFVNENNAEESLFDPTGIGAGILPDRSDWVIPPNAISRKKYPGLWKLGTYRTDNNGGLGAPNGGITRPFNIAKFSELYFIAAEAAVKGAATTAGKSARDLINVIRARAGKWRYYNKNREERVEDNSQAMMDATPAIVDIDYILQERSREYFGEGYRWFDLVRTQKWSEVAATYEIAGSSKYDHVAETHTRSIQPYLYLRPIPRGQLDRMTMTEAEKAEYQNPGYAN